MQNENRIKNFCLVWLYNIELRSSIYSNGVEHSIMLLKAKEKYIFVATTIKQFTNIKPDATSLSMIDALLRNI